MIEWHKVSDGPPKYIKGLKKSERILILDGNRVAIGEYILGKYECWFGSYCNTDHHGSQKTITHWAEINLLESKDGL